MSRELEHLKFWSGQLLASADFRELVASDARRRALHNRAVHHAYGVAIGLVVTGGPQDYDVMCGLAYDCSGAEILVPHSVSVPRSEDPTKTVLVVARDGSGRPEFSWVAPGRFSWRRGVALKWLNSAGALPIVARALARPKMASGRTVPGGTSWQSWRGSHEEEIGVRTRVDTSSAGFVTTPHYFASVRGDKDAPGTWFVSIADATPTSFSLQLFFRRITRQHLEIQNPIGRVTAAPTGAKLQVTDAAKFLRGDLIVRLSPIAGTAAAIKSIAGTTVTLKTALAIGNAARLVAVGHLPRGAVADSIPALDPTVLKLDNVTGFTTGGVIVRLRPPVAGARPCVIETVDAVNNTITLRTALRPLVEQDTVGQASASSIVTDVKAEKVTVINPALFAVGTIVVRLGTNVEFSMPAVVVAVTGNVLTLSGSIDGLVIGGELGVIGPSARVTSIGAVPDVTIPIRGANVFEKDDIVTRRVVGGLFSAPARVTKIGTKNNKPTVTLSAPLAGLAAGDTISGMDAGARATVLTVSTVGNAQTLTVSNAQPYSVGAFVARVDEEGAFSAPSTVQGVASSTTIVIEPAIADLVAGQVLAVLTVPAVATVAAVDADGRTIRTNDPHRFKPLDTISAMPSREGLALVTAVDGLTLRVTPKLTTLQPGDHIQAVALTTVLEATAQTDRILDVDDAAALRESDVLTLIDGWREVTPQRTLEDVTGNTLRLGDVLDGTLLHDVVGLASLLPDRLVLRLKQAEGVNRGDDVILAGFDRLTGETASPTARVTDVNQTRTRLLLTVDPGQAPFTLRPEDVDASVPLISGSPVRIANQFHLYATWLACDELPHRPEPCTDPDPPPGPCDPPPSKEKTLLSEEKTRCC